MPLSPAAPSSSSGGITSSTTTKSYPASGDRWTGFGDALVDVRGDADLVAQGLRFCRPGRTLPGGVSGPSDLRHSSVRAVDRPSSARRRFGGLRLDQRASAPWSPAPRCLRRGGPGAAAFAPNRRRASNSVREPFGTVAAARIHDPLPPVVCVAVGRSSFRPGAPAQPGIFRLEFGAARDADADRPRFVRRRLALRLRWRADRRGRRWRLLFKQMLLAARSANERGCCAPSHDARAAVASRIVETGAVRERVRLLRHGLDTDFFASRPRAAGMRHWHRRAYCFWPTLPNAREYSSLSTCFAAVRTVRPGCYADRCGNRAGGRGGRTPGCGPRAVGLRAAAR